MIYIFFVILVVISLLLVWLIFDLKKRLEGGKDPEKTAAIMERLTMLSEQNRDLRQTMDSKLSETHRATQDQFSQTMRTMQGISGQSAKIIGEVTEKLTKLDETNKQVLDFSNQLQNLQDILKNPKQRGVFGEYYLETLLKNAFSPNQYQMQYSLGKDEKTGKDLIVDAALFFGDKIIPIDSKFSLENYNRILEEKNPVAKEQLEKLFKQDLKNRIDETAKYIQPGKGTTEYAFMFIPAEGIYYDLLVNKVGAIQVNTRDLIDYAINEKKVHIVSPTTFYVTLQALIQGMRAYQIQESTKEIIKNVGKLGNHIKSYDDYFKKLGGHLQTTVNAYNNAHKEFNKIDKDVAKITGGESQIEPLIIDKPQEE
ncbi:MAG: DNA recombination protein RmuC [Candidatus Moranbacteria bacterium]|nr:DNA recombination protein RmuC [Candidatus Moranbacteria bacterium]